MATHSSTLAWKTPRTEEFYSLQSMESPRFWHDWLLHFFQFSSVQVQLLSCVQLFATPWTAARQAYLSITNSWSLFKPMSIELVMPSSHLIVCHPLLLLPPIPPSIRVFASGSTPHFFMRNENWPFPVLWPLLSFPNLLAYWVPHIHSIIF